MDENLRKEPALQLKASNEMIDDENLRKQQALQLKASNEMIEDLKKSVIARFGEDSDLCKKKLKQLGEAQSQNVEKMKTALNVDISDLEGVSYNTVTEKEVELYNENLKKQGRTDEMVRNKNIDEVIKLMDEQKSKTTKKNKNSKLKELTNKLQNSLKKKNETVNVEKEPETTIFVTENKVVDKVTENKVLPENEVEKDLLYEDFDPRDIPSYVQYDIIPLPSKGECYKHKKNRLPVAYLTAADENLILSRNLYNSNSMIDIILERKILDKSIRVADLCQGDRDAIAIWLRATAYGPDYPIIAYHEGEEIETSINLNEIEYLDFKLKSDENGHFEYKTNKGDILKFKILTHKEEEDLLKSHKDRVELVNRSLIIENLNKTSLLVNACESKNKEDILETISVIKEWAINDDEIKEIIDRQELIYTTIITDRMVAQTMAVNGNTDREYIKNYIENMLAKDSLDYRKFLVENTPGVNLEITVPIPESLGGGSFNTFLSIGDTIFSNV